MPPARLVVSVMYPSGERDDVPVPRRATRISPPINRFGPLAPADKDGYDDDVPEAAGGADGAGQGRGGRCGGRGGGCPGHLARAATKRTASPTAWPASAR